jgi:hypothetical protein
MLKLDSAEVRAEESAEDMILPKTYCVSAEGMLPAEVVDSADIMYADKYNRVLFS